MPFAMQRLQALSRTPLLFSILFLILLCFRSTGAGLIKECKRVGAEELIDEEGCDLLIVRVNRCSGYCFSVTFPNPLTGKTNSASSKCCRMTDTEWVYAELTCVDGPRQIRIPSALKCECFDCPMH